MNTTPRFDAAYSKCLDDTGAVTRLEPLFTFAKSAEVEISRLTDQLDLARDEFRRIASCPSADSEIKALCARGQTNINQHVPVIAQRDAAESRAAKLQRGLMTFIGCDTKQELITLRAACEAMPPDDNQRLSIVAIDTVLEAMQ